MLDWTQSAMGAAYFAVERLPWTEGRAERFNKRPAT